MEVICDRCNAEYEFEEALVSTGGTTVKCTNCGHLFKVYRAPSTPSTSGTAGRSWTIQYENGRLEQIPSLRDITERMTTGQLQPGDQVSRTGRVFRKLGEIEELQHFFPPAAAIRHRRQRASGGAPSPRARVDSAAIQRIIEPDDGDDDITQPGELPFGDRHRPPAQAGPRAPLPAPYPSPHPSPLPELGARARATARRGRLLVGAAVVLAAGLLFLFWPQAPSAPKSPESAASSDETQVDRSIRAAIELGDQVLASYDLQRFSEAAYAYSQALEAYPNDPHLLSSLSRLHAHWSQRLLFELHDLHDNRHPPPVPRLDSLSEQQQEQAELAKTYAVRAARKNPGNEESEVALADALRLNGNLVAARAELDRARNGQQHADGETLRVAALLAIAEDENALKAGDALSARAARQSDCGLACRILRIRVLDAVERDQAQVALQQLAEEFPNSPEVAYLRAVLDSPPPPPADTEQTAAATPRAGTENDPRRTTTNRPPAQAPTAGKADEKPRAEGKSAEQSPRAQLIALCRQGERALEDGDVAAAAVFFDQAHALRPNSPRVATGRGFIALEQDQPGRATDLFKSATAQKYGEAYIGLGLSLRKLGKLDEAEAAYRAYLQYFPSGRSANIAQSQLAALQRR